MAPRLVWRVVRPLEYSICEPIHPHGLRSTTRCRRNHRKSARRHRRHHHRRGRGTNYTSNSHYHPMSVSVFACPRFEPAYGAGSGENCPALRDRAERRENLPVRADVLTRSPPNSCTGLDRCRMRTKSAMLDRSRFSAITAT